MSDKEDTAATLGDSEVLRVEYPPREAVPELNQRPEDASKSLSVVAAENTGDVFPYDPLRPVARGDLAEGEGEVSAGVGETASEACDAEALAGGASDEKIESWDFDGAICDPCHVPDVRDARETMREDARGERFDLALRDEVEPERGPRTLGGADAAAHRKDFHGREPPTDASISSTAPTMCSAAHPRIASTRIDQ